MKKIVFLRVACSSTTQQRQLDDGAHPTALVLQKTADGYLNIQGHARVAWSERHQCWQLFRRAAKNLLGVCEASAVSVCLSEPPHTAICDLANIFRQPSHIVSLTLFSLPNETEEEDEHRTCSRSATTAEGRVCYNWQQGQPTSLPSGLYNPPRRVSPSSPYSSPQTQRRHNGKVYNSLEMDKLLTQLDEVSQSLERTQSRCEAIARRCGNKTRENSEHSAEGGGGEETDCTDEDSRVEHLLQVAETLTSQIIKQQMKKQNHSRSSPKPGTATSWQPMTSSLKTAGLPECPSDVYVQPNVNGGAFVFWSPVRLDDKDTNNGHKVIGYAVYIDGVQRTIISEPFGSHAEIDGLKNGVQYKIQVRTLTDNEDRESDLTAPFLYRHDCHTHHSTTHHPPNNHQNQSAKVENWLLRTSQQIPSPSNKTPLVGDNRSEFTGCHDNTNKSSEDKLLTTPPHSTHLSDDVWSMGTSHTSGIVMDHPPSSPKLTPSCPSFCHGDGFSVNSGATTLIVDGQLSSLSPYHPHHQIHFSPSPTPSPTVTPSRAQSPASRRSQVGDTVIDEPLDLLAIPSEVKERGRASTTVQLVAGTRNRGPAPPCNVQVKYKQTGHINISWKPIRRDNKGCSNGCFVLGYRIYINGTSSISVDGPMSYMTSVRWPHHLDSAHKITVHVRTRSIASESVPSSTIIYDMLLQESVEQYSGQKVGSTLSSTTTLCPSDRPHPQSLHKPTPAHNSHIAVSGKETYV